MPLVPAASMTSKMSWPTPVHSIDDVGLDAGVGDRAVVVGGAQRGHQVGLEAVGDLVEHVDLETPLHAEQGGEQADRAGAGDQHLRGLPYGPGADALDVVPRLGHHRGRLEQHAEVAERGVDLDDVVGRDAVALAGVAVVLLDAPLGVLAVAAHVPFADGAVGAGDRVGPADDADDQIAGGQPAAGRRLQHLAERLVPDGQAVLARAAPSRTLRR